MIDRLRREASREARHVQAELLRAAEVPDADIHAWPDDRLRLIFTCCHPALALNVRVVFTPTPIVALNRAVALAEVEGPAPALALVEPLPLGGFHVFHAVRADLLRRLGRA